MRPGTIRSWRASARQDSVMPWRGYMLWVGGTLLLLLLALDGLMPRTAFSHAATAEVRFPPIRIHSAVKGPEAVVIECALVRPWRHVDSIDSLVRVAAVPGQFHSIVRPHPEHEHIVDDVSLSKREVVNR